jgi:hypothetical protein
MAFRVQNESGTSQLQSRSGNHSTILLGIPFTFHFSQILPLKRLIYEPHATLGSTELTAYDNYKNMI